MTGDDQRGRAFTAAVGNKFANAFPSSLAPDENNRFNLFEFPVGIARKLGLGIPILLPYVGTRIKTEGDSMPVLVDPFGNGITSATGVRGGHVTEMHNAFSRALMSTVKSAGVSVKGATAHDTCNGVFGKCLRSDSLLSESDEAEIEKQLQKIIPDGIVMAENIAAPSPYEHPHNPLFGKQTLTDAKTLASHAKTPDQRADEFQREIANKVKELDIDYPGSTFEQTLKSYGVDGLYLVLVVGPFSNLSKDVGLIIDFVARLRAVRLINNWDMSARQALALNRRLLVQKFGHLATLLWAKLILGRFRDAVSRIPLKTTTGAGSGKGASDNDDPTILLNVNGGAYRGSNVPGA
jgi:hypothetical protein